MLYLSFFVDGLGDSAGENFDCFVGNGARYRGLFVGIIGEIHEIKAPVIAGALLS